MNIVLVQGWECVYKILEKDGYTITVVRNSTIFLVDDMAATNTRRWVLKENPKGTTDALMNFLGLFRQA